ncbi:hypothetical protein CDAR_121631 [Caerostris darwini]|uniref:Uncharacterized protein n=1 Tax=Caerostris darwini TaxID=1538125 RepID=A0AAV4V953_9ARAC|nr:hypothetical protein CDAR_121631 [Caerostris darwini]
MCTLSSHGSLEARFSICFQLVERNKIRDPLIPGGDPNQTIKFRKKESYPLDSDWNNNWKQTNDLLESRWRPFFLLWDAILRNLRVCKFEGSDKKRCLLLSLKKYVEINRFS